MELKSYKNCLHANDNRFIGGVNKNNCEHQGITVFYIEELHTFNAVYNANYDTFLLER